MQHLIIWLALGLAAGWLARISMSNEYRFGIIGDLTIGGLGAVIGGWGMRALHRVAPENFLGHGVTALAGAIVLLAAIRGLARMMSAVNHATAPTDHDSGLEFDSWLRRANEFERTLLARLIRRQTDQRDPNQTFEASLTFGERIADQVASFGGSWTFIGLFFISMISWMILNEESGHAFDPYPFILLNLVLSCLAAIQAPIIMMSQNRQTARDRADVRSDYEVNLRAEMQIMLLHEKLDSARREEFTLILAELRQFREWRERFEQRDPSKDAL